MELPGEIFVVVLEKDLPDEDLASHPEHEVDSIVMGTPIKLATKRHASGIAKRSTENGHGKSLIGRVVFVDADQLKVNPLSVACIPSNSCVDGLLELLNPDFSDFHDGEKFRQRFEILQWIKIL